MADARASKVRPTRWGVGSSPTLPTMKKRTVNISEEVVFDDITDKVETEEIIGDLTRKWKDKDFSKKVYFNKRITKIRNAASQGTIDFIRAYKPK